MDLARRFWSKVRVIDDESSCWEWQRSKHRNGYGQFSEGQRHTLAHRVAYRLANGGDPPEGRCVLHRCDNRACCRPSHLFAGTKRDNTQDMIRKGRHRYNPQARATHCRRGHPLTPETAVTVKGHLQCRACNTLRARERRHRKANATVHATRDSGAVR